VFDPRVVAIACILLALAATRAPLLTSPHSYLDGDEALMGVTALHVLAGEPLPVLPYGAVFGVSLPETISAVAAVDVLGPSELALRLSALAVWVLATALLALAARWIAGGPGAIAVALVGESADAPALERTLRAQGLPRAALPSAAEGYFALVNPPASLLVDFRSSE